MPEFTGHRDIRSYIRTIWRWKLLILVFVIGAPAIAFLLEHGKPKQYAATAKVSLLQSTGNSTSSNPFETGNVPAVAELILTSPVADIAGAELSPPESGAEAVSGVSTSADVLTNFITITAVKGNPNTAAAVANAFAKALNIAGSKQAKAALRSEIRTTRAQLRVINRSSANYPVLQANLQSYEADLAQSNDVAQTVQAATPDSTPVGPHPRRAVELGLVIGILLAAAVVMLLDSVDRRLRSPDELEELTKLPLLAAIAPSAFEEGLASSPVDEEAFHTLRTSLTYFTVDKKITSVLVTSPGEQEGKSTVAVRLALASASAGLDVVLVDADLRRAGATTKLGLKPTIGLGLVLAEQRPVESALIPWPLAADDTGRLRVLAAGNPPPNPAALISSAQMRDLLQTLEQQADLVVIDTPAALAVSDAVPLMQHVSGVVMVGRMNRSTRDTIRRLQKIINSTGARQLGTIATGVQSGPGYEKYSQSYYGSGGRGSGGRQGLGRVGRSKHSRRGAQVRLGQPPPKADADAQAARVFD